MSTYLLDTNILIYILNNRPANVARKFNKISPKEIGVSIISYGELCFGAEKSNHPKKAHALLEVFFREIPILPLSVEAAVEYAKTRAFLNKKGVVIGPNDLWIAAHALSLNRILVTNNLKEFKRVPHLKVENWIKDAFIN